MKIDLLEAFGIDQKLISLWKQKYAEELLPLQEKSIKEFNIFSGENIIVFAPTSSGKTFIGEMVAIHHCLKHKKVLYLVPTKSLAEEKFAEFNLWYSPLGIRTVISTRDRQEFDNNIFSGEFDLAIIIYEKLLSLFVRRPELLSFVGCIIFDELQMISDDTRGPSVEILLNYIKLYKQKNKDLQLIGLSAVLGKCELLSRWLGAKLLFDTTRPVELRQGVYCDGKFYYQEFNTKSVSSEDWVKIDYELPSEPQQQILVELEVISEVAKYLAEKDEQVLIFLKDKKTVHEVAKEISQKVNFPKAEDAIKEISSSEKTFISEFLIKLLSKGICIHHADLTYEQREIIERYFRRGDIRILVSTSTLALGVNLPCKNVLVEPRKWYFDKKSGVLSMAGITKSDFESMGGRAGRFKIEKDFGRAVIVALAELKRKVYFENLILSDFEELRGMFTSDDLDKLVLYLVASNIENDKKAILEFVSGLFSKQTGWDIKDEDLELMIDKILNYCKENKIVVEDKYGRYVATEYGYIGATKGVYIDTLVKMISYIENVDAKKLTSKEGLLEMLLTLSFTRDGSEIYIPLEIEEIANIKEYLKNLLLKFEVDLRKYFGGIITKYWSYQDAQAVKRALCLYDWLSSKETIDIEEAFVTHAGAIRRVAEEFSWLIDTLADLFSVSKISCVDEITHQDVVKKLKNIATCIVYGVEEKAVDIAKIRLRSLSRTYIKKLVEAGFEKEEALKQLSLEQLESLLPKKVAYELYAYLHKEFNKQLLKVHIEEMSVQAKPKKAVYETINEVLSNKQAINDIREAINNGRQLADVVKTLPKIVIDKKEQNVFYFGYLVILPEQTFKMFYILAKNVGQAVKKEEIYEYLYGSKSSKNMPYEQQLRDHKRKIIQKLKSVAKKYKIKQKEIKDLIKTKYKVGYILNLTKEDVVIIK